MDIGIYIVIGTILVISVLMIVDYFLQKKLKKMYYELGTIEGYRKALRDIEKRIGSCRNCEHYVDGHCLKIKFLEPKPTWFCASFKQRKEEDND